MAATFITVSREQVQIALGQVTASVADRDGMLKVIGELMRASIARTFREEGSPAGSWPALAASTRKKAGYTAGHKLLILSGRLFSSISYMVAAGVLTVGTNVVYARVQQYGSADRSGGSIGPQAKVDGRGVKVKAFDYLRIVEFHRGKRGGTRVTYKRGTPGPNDSTKTFHARSHTRHQNIPARPYLVFRPEDPGRFASGVDAYLRGKTPSLGMRAIP